VTTLVGCLARCGERYAVSRKCRHLRADLAGGEMLGLVHLSS
jgi:hypothetical protein